MRDKSMMHEKAMAHSRFSELGRKLVAGELSLAEFAAQCETAAFVDLGDTKVDIDRQRRCGFPEVVFGAGKTVETIASSLEMLASVGHDALATRVSREQAGGLSPRLPAGRYNAVARTFRLPASRQSGSTQTDMRRGRVAIVVAGTSDLPVAEEARETADWMGAETLLVQDVGVAGPQRLLARLHEIRRADAVVVIAGMEAALASVVAGHVAVPVIAVPTSVGYGANFGGVTALLSMLNSCAAHVAVVNIDAGFKGAYLAAMIALQKQREAMP